MPMIREAVQNFTPSPEGEQVGTVLTVGDGIATVSGLPNAEYGEILVFENGLKGMILDLKEEEIGCVIFGDDADIMQGSTVRRTGKVAGMPVGRAFLGRVVNALGEAVDGAGRFPLSSSISSASRNSNTRSPAAAADWSVCATCASCDSGCVK